MAGIAIVFVALFAGPDDAGWRSKNQPSARALGPYDQYAPGTYAPGTYAPGTSGSAAGSVAQDTGNVQTASAFDPLPSADEMVDRAEAAARSEVGNALDRAADAVRRQLDSRGFTTDPTRSPMAGANPPSSPPASAGPPSLPGTSVPRTNWPEIRQVLDAPFDATRSVSSTEPGPGGRMRRDPLQSLPPVPPQERPVPTATRTVNDSANPAASGYRAAPNASRAAPSARRAPPSRSSLHDWLDQNEDVAPPGTHVELPPITSQASDSYDQRPGFDLRDASVDGRSRSGNVPPPTSGARRNDRTVASPPRTRSADEFDRWAADMRRDTLNAPPASRTGQRQFEDEEAGFPGGGAAWDEGRFPGDERSGDRNLDSRFGASRPGDRDYIQPPPRTAADSRDRQLDLVPPPAANSNDRTSTVETAHANSPSDQTRSPAADRPWGPLALAVLALFGSIGFNFYLGWIAWDLYTRYQDAVEDVHELEAKLEEKQLEHSLV